MKIDTVQINGTSYRVEINMNSCEHWERLANKKLGQFEIESAESAKTGGVATRPMLLWLYVAIIEGEELDGKSFELDFLEFKRMLRPTIMSQFAPIFIKQYMGDIQAKQETEDQKKDEKKKKSIRSRLSSFAKSRWVKWGGVLLTLGIAVRYFFGVRFGG